MPSVGPTHTRIRMGSEYNGIVETACRSSQEYQEGREGRDAKTHCGALTEGDTHCARKGRCESSQAKAKTRLAPLYIGEQG